MNPANFGPGRYDGWCTRVREAVHARGVLLIVIGGEDGAGFSCQADLITTARVPEIIEGVARQIRGTPPASERALEESLLQAVNNITALRRELDIANEKLRALQGEST